MPSPAGYTHEVKIYQAADGWRWRLRALNGLIVADGGQAYSRRDGALLGFRRAWSARVVQREQEPTA